MEGIARVLFPWIGGVTSIVAAVSLFGKTSSVKVFRVLFYPLVSLCSLVAVQLLMSDWIVDKRVADVEQYVEDIEPLLEDYYSRNGAYPQDFRVVGKTKVPFYLRSSGAFIPNKNDWMFYYETPDSIMGGKMYSKLQPYWQVAD